MGPSFLCKSGLHLRIKLFFSLLKAVRKHARTELNLPSGRNQVSPEYHMNYLPITYDDSVISEGRTSTQHYSILGRDTPRSGRS
jgi:hypothetical protein